MDASFGILFGFIAMLGYGLNAFFLKAPIARIGPTKAIFFRTFFVTLILLMVFLYFISETTFSLYYILIASIISIIGYFPFAAFCKALKIEKLGIVTPISGSSVMFTILFSIIFFGESLTPVQSFSIILILAGIILISLNLKELKSPNILKISPGVFLALFAALLWGLVYFLFKIPVSIIGPFLTSLIIEFGVLVSSGVHLKISKMDFKIPNKEILFYTFLAGLGGGAGTLFYNLGIKVADVSIVAAIMFANPLIAVLCGRFTGEKLSKLQYFAILVLITGIVLLSFF